MNTEEKIASVIEKIRHLQAKGGANATIDEMATATAIAAKLMAQYQISQAQVDLRNKTVSSFERRVIATVSKRSNHLEILLDALCKTYSAAWHMSHSGYRETSYVVVSHSSDFEIISYFLCGYLMDELEGLSEKFCEGMGLSYAHSWKIGCASAIAEKFAALRKERTQDLRNAQMGDASQETCAAMVLVDRRGAEAAEWMNAEVKKFFCRHCGFSCNRGQEAEWKIIMTLVEFAGKPMCPKCKKPGKIHGMKSSASLTGVSDRDGYSSGKKIGANVSIRFGMGSGIGGGTKGELGR